MNANRKLWIGLGTLLVLSFSVLLWVGTEIHRVMPPIPAKDAEGEDQQGAESDPQLDWNS